MSEVDAATWSEAELVLVGAAAGGASAAAATAVGVGATVGMPVGGADCASVGVVVGGAARVAVVAGTVLQPTIKATISAHPTRLHIWAERMGNALLCASYLASWVRRTGAAVRTRRRRASAALPTSTPTSRYACPAPASCAVHALSAASAPTHTWST